MANLQVLYDLRRVPGSRCYGLANLYSTQVTSSVNAQRHLPVCKPDAQQPGRLWKHVRFETLFQDATDRSRMPDSKGSSPG